MSSAKQAKKSHVTENRDIQRSPATARVCWVSCKTVLMGTWWPVVLKSLWGNQGCSHNTAMTCFLLFLMLPAAPDSQEDTLLAPRCAEVLLHEQNQHGQCDLQQVQGSLEILFQLPEMKCKQIVAYWVSMFSSLLTAGVANGWLITCPSHASARNPQKASNPPSSQAEPHTCKVLHLFFQPSYSFLHPLYN